MQSPRWCLCVIRHKKAPTMTFCPNNLLNSVAISGTSTVSAMSSKVSHCFKTIPIVLEVFPFPPTFFFVHFNYGFYSALPFNSWKLLQFDSLWFSCYLLHSNVKSSMIKWATLIEYKQDLDSSIKVPCMFNSYLSVYHQKHIRRFMMILVHFL